MKTGAENVKFCTEIQYMYVYTCNEKYRLKSTTANMAEMRDLEAISDTFNTGLVQR